MSAPAEWFRDWFGDAYLELYPHRDEEEAARGVALYRERSGLRAGARVLDLACGAGRHLRRLRAAGLRASGIDLSAPLLRAALGRPGLAGSLVRADMRALPFADTCFDGLVNFFTSFGYFLSPEEDIQVLGEIRRVLRPGAPFLMDYLNAAWVMERLDPESVGEVNGTPVRQTRWVEGDQVFKRIEIGGGAGKPPQVYHERVRLYAPEALRDLLREKGLDMRDRFGNYDGAPFGPDSPRLLMMGRAL
ncbi:class I SAM-dependent methyltransferase [Candidatus Palauibacter sp.]|uniref:class I SAM-dependent methyltransferase n=1 Tax=Candidatus Palauibacter sp. TaxID=3101350 RepID=UPI003B014484